MCIQMAKYSVQQRQPYGFDAKVNIIIIIFIIRAYLQSHVTPTQMMMTQTTDDTPIIATRMITDVCTPQNHLTHSEDECV